jgi:hypothetical protein
LLDSAAANQSAHLEDHGISNAVTDVESLSPSVHQTFLTKRLEVLGNIGLACLQKIDNISDWFFSVLQRLKDPQSHRFPERTKALCDQLGHGVI